MLLFVFALAVALLGLGAYDLYNPGTSDVTIAGYHFAAVPDWGPIAAAAGLPLSLFLMYALWTSVRIHVLKRAARRTPDGDWELVERAPAPVPVRASVPAQRAAVPAQRAAVSPQPAPKRSWLPPD